MEARLIRRPVTDLLSGRNQCLLSLNATSRRHESSYRRTKQRLNVGPDASFLQSKNPPQQDHIIFNPPSSAPSVLHTPLKFLPKEDKRRQLFVATASKFGAAPNARLPPPISAKKTTLPHHHLTDMEIKEIQRLSRDDPQTWTIFKLARKFKCSSYFIHTCRDEMPVLPVHDEIKRQQMANLQAVKDRWGPRRRMAREDRSKRIDLALKDQ